MNFGKIICLLVGMMLLHLTSSACSCDHSGTTFLTSLDAFTAEFEVVEIDSFQNPRSEYYPIVLTKLRITKIFQGETDVDFVWMDNSSGTDCQQGMFATHIGQKYMLTGRMFKDVRYNEYLKVEKSITSFYVTTCGKTVLHVENGFVYGAVDTDMDKLINEKYQELKKEDEEKATQYRKEVYTTRFHEERYQQFTINEFYALMEDHFGDE